MVLAMAMISSNDALIKSASEDLSIAQILLIRGIVACLIFGALIKSTGRPLFPGVIVDRTNLLRGALEIAATLCFVTGLSLLPIATATTLAWTSPLLLTVVGVVLLREPPTATRWLAVLAGFAGVLLITRPFGAGFSAAMVLPLLAAFLVAMRDFVTRKIDPRISSFTVTFTTLVLVTIAGGVISWFTWNPLAMNQVIKLCFAAGLLALGFHSMIEAVRMGDLSFVAPFTFTAILMALLLGYFVWNDVPTPFMLSGVVLIVGACLYILRYGGVDGGEPGDDVVP